MSRIIDAYICLGLNEVSVTDNKAEESPLMPSVLSVFPTDYDYPACLPLLCLPWGMSVKDPLCKATSESYHVALATSDGRYLHCECLLVYEDANRKPCSIDPSAFEVPRSYQTTAQRRSRRKNCWGSLDMSSETPLSDQIHYDYNQELTPKCYVLVSKLPYVKSLRQILYRLYYSARNDIVFPVDLKLTHLVSNLKLSEENEMIFNINELVLPFKIPKVMNFPLIDCDITSLFQVLGVKSLITLILGLSVEEKVVLLANSVKKLGDCGMALVSLLYPFVWTHAFYPCIPTNLLDYLHSSEPFIIGVHTQSHQEVLNRCERAYIVNLETGTVEFYSYKSLGNPNENQAVPPPETFVRKLEKKLNRVYPGLNKDLLQVPYEGYTDQAVRHAFCRFFLKFLINTTQATPTFNHLPVDCRLYVQLLLNTQMFSSYSSKNPETSPEIKYFWQQLQNKRNRVKKHQAIPSFFEGTPSKSAHTMPKLEISPDIFSKTESDMTIPPLKFDQLDSLNFARFFRKGSANFYQETSYSGVLWLWVKVWLFSLREQPREEYFEQLHEFARKLSLVRLKMSRYNFIVDTACQTDFQLGLSIFSLLSRSCLDLPVLSFVHQTIEKHAVNPTIGVVEKSGRRTLLKYVKNFPQELISIAHITECSVCQRATEEKCCDEDPGTVLSVELTDGNTVLCKEVCKLMTEKELGDKLKECRQGPVGTLAGLRMRYSALFWNLVDLFRQNELTYQFMVPFEDDIASARKNQETQTALNGIQLSQAIEEFLRMQES